MHPILETPPPPPPLCAGGGLTVPCGLHQVDAATPLTEAIFREWREKKIAERRAKEDKAKEERIKAQRFTGRELFAMEGFVAVDDNRWECLGCGESDTHYLIYHV